MIARDTLVAGVLAATDRVVQQIGNGDLNAALKSSADRRALLDQLAKQDPTAAEHGFLRALREAAAESDAALAKISSAPKVDVAPRTAAEGGRLCLKA